MIEREEGREKETWEKELEETKDLEFYRLFGVEMGRVRREWSGGKSHWYLVSAVSSASVHLGDEGGTLDLVSR